MTACDQFAPEQFRSLSNNSLRHEQPGFAVNISVRFTMWTTGEALALRRNRAGAQRRGLAKAEFVISPSNPIACGDHKGGNHAGSAICQRPIACAYSMRGSKAAMPISADSCDHLPRSDEASGNRIYLDTSKLPQQDRLPALGNAMRRHMFDCDVKLTMAGPFCATLDLRWAGAVGVAQIATSPIDIVRDASHLNPRNDQLVVQFVQHGTVHVSQDDHDISAGAGESVILDCRETSRLRITETSSAWFLIFPRKEIARPEHRARRLAGIKLIDMALLRLLSGYLNSMWKEDLGDHRAAQMFGGHLVDLIALALSEKETSPPVEQGGLRASRLVEVLQLISDQIGNPGLSVAAVAEQMGVTPRYIHLLLERSDKTFAKHVLQKRLERAFALLSADTKADRRIADIASAAGFSDLSYFNRAFRRQFGDTPSRIRANSARRF